MSNKRARNAIVHRLILTGFYTRVIAPLGHIGVYWCGNCRHYAWDHTRGKCLFGHTCFQQGKPAHFEEWYTRQAWIGITVEGALKKAPRRYRRTHRWHRG